MIHNEPVRNAIAVARLGPLEQRLFNHSLRIWTNGTQPCLYELHGFVKDNFPSQLDVIPGVRNYLKHKRIVRMILEQSNDQYQRALTELVIFAHSKMDNRIQ